MRPLIALASFVALAACAMTPQQKAALTLVCQVDGVVQPMSLPVVASTGNTGVAAATVDSLIVHPAVVTACAQLNGVTVVVPASAVPAAPVVPAKG